MEKKKEEIGGVREQLYMKRPKLQHTSHPFKLPCNT